MMAVLIKDPDARLDYAIDWSDYLDVDETIAASEWRVMPDAALIASSDSLDGALAQVVLSGGKSGDLYRVTNRITTSLGRIDDRSLTIHVQER